MLTMMEKIIYFLLVMFLVLACTENDSETEEIIDTDATSGTFIDTRDKKEYKWVKIGEQIWMAENLAYLPFVSSTENDNLDKPNFYVYGYNGTNADSAKATINYSEYGVLYNWQAAIISCPVGWHLPTDEEWKELEIELGMSVDQANEHVSPFYRGTDQGMKMKTSRGWHNNGNGNNVSRFSGLPSGFRFVNGSYSYIEGFGYWWSSSDALSSSAWGRGLSYNNCCVFRNSFNKRNGLCIRCVKNKD